MDFVKVGVIEGILEKHKLNSDRLGELARRLAVERLLKGGPIDAFARFFGETAETAKISAGPELAMMLVDACAATPRREKARVKILALYHDDNGIEIDVARGYKRIAEFIEPLDRVCSRQVIVELFHHEPNNRLAAAINRMIESMPGWRRCDRPMRFGDYGVQRGFERIKESSSLGDLW